MNQTKSLALLAKAERLIPACSQTYSKGPTYFIRGVYPAFLESGNGCYVMDVDGNKYCDYILALGPITLGYNYPRVNEAIKTQLVKGISFSMPHRLEIELAELLQEIIPCCEKMRLSKTGSDVCSAAVKAARAYTGREHLVYWGYHGTHSWYSIVTDRPEGVPVVYKDFMHTFTYNNLDSLEKQLSAHKIAAVIMEPMGIVYPALGFLAGVKQLCAKYGAVLIFDEMITGFRLDLGGAQKFFGVTPDLATFGKGMANGMPLAALMGKAEIMDMFDIDHKAFFSTTFGGETLSIAAAIATISEMREQDTIGHIRKIGTKLQQGLSGIKGLSVAGYPNRVVPILVEDNTERKSLLMQEMCKRGFLMHSTGLNLCYSHGVEEIDRTLTAFVESMQLISEDKVKLEGPPIRPTFKRL